MNVIESIHCLLHRHLSRIVIWFWKLFNPDLVSEYNSYLYANAELIAALYIQYLRDTSPYIHPLKAYLNNAADDCINEFCEGLVEDGDDFMVVDAEGATVVIVKSPTNPAFDQLWAIGLIDLPDGERDNCMCFQYRCDCIRRTFNLRKKGES